MAVLTRPRIRMITAYTLTCKGDISKDPNPSKNKSMVNKGMLRVSLPQERGPQLVIQYHRVSPEIYTHKKSYID